MCTHTCMSHKSKSLKLEYRHWCFSSSDDSNVYPGLRTPNLGSARVLPDCVEVEDHRPKLSSGSGVQMRRETFTCLGSRTNNTW